MSGNEQVVSGMTRLQKANRLLWFFGILKIRMLHFVRPRVVELGEDRIVIRIRLSRRTRNHLNSMYLGAFAVGGDLAGGFQAFMLGRETGEKFSLIFSRFEATFIKRAEDDVFFIAETGRIVREIMAESRLSGERVTRDIPIKAVVNYNKKEEETVAEIILGLSIKVKG